MFTLIFKQKVLLWGRRGSKNERFKKLLDWVSDFFTMLYFLSMFLFIIKILTLEYFTFKDVVCLKIFLYVFVLSGSLMLLLSVLEEYLKRVLKTRF